MMDKKTDCECNEPGFCTRHKCYKTSHFYQLCKYHEGYFQLYEKGIGPCFDKPVIESPRRYNPLSMDELHDPLFSGIVSELPSLWQQAKNLGGSLIKNTKNKFKAVSEEEYEARLNICHTSGPSGSFCKFYILNGDHPRCGGCGCFLEAKAIWEAEECPIGKWSKFTPDNSGIKESGV